MSEAEDAKNPDKAALFDSVSKGQLAVIILELLESMTAISRMMQDYADGSESYRTSASLAIEKMLADDREMVARSLLPEIDLDALTKTGEREDRTRQVSLFDKKGKAAPYLVEQMNAATRKRAGEIAKSIATPDAPSVKARRHSFNPNQPIEDVTHRIAADGAITRVEVPKQAGRLSFFDQRIKRDVINAKSTLTSAELVAMGIPERANAEDRGVHFDTIKILSRNGVYHIARLRRLLLDQKIKLLVSLVSQDADIERDDNDRQLDWLFDVDAEGSERLIGSDDDEPQQEDGS